MSGRLPTLDGLRFLAVSVVVLGHGGWAVSSGEGVSYFFVLSGMLITWLLVQEWRQTADTCFRKFYLRRTLRIVPAFYFAVLLTILGKAALGLPIDWRHALTAVTFTANYYNGLHGHPPTGFDCYWSLAIEEQFYLLWPLLFLFFARTGLRRARWFLIAVIVAACLWRSYLYIGRAFPKAYVYNAFETRCDALAFGCLLGLLLHEPRFIAACRRFARSAYQPLLTLLALLGLKLMTPSLRYSFGLTLQALVLAVFLLQMVLLSEHPALRWLSSRPLRYLGALSFSIYLYHGWGLALAHQLPGIPHALRPGLGLVLAIGLAAISYDLIERPVRDLRRRLEKRLTARESMAPPASPAQLAT